MKTVTIGFSYSNKIFSRLIRFVTRSKVSHAYVRYTEPETGIELIAQASGLSVNIQSRDYFLTYENVVFELPVQVTNEDYKIGEAFKYSTLGKPYSMKEIFGFGWVLLARAFGQNVKNPGADGSHGYVCSKFVCNYISLSDVKENITPEDLLLMLQNRKGLSHG